MATQEPVAALTFDDGPHPEFTLRVLDTLERHQARATFFMIGANALRHPDLVRMVAARGHAIGNHSWDHPIFPLITGRERRSQIHACARAIAPYGRRLFRPPHGYHNVASHLDALLLGYKVVNWSVAVDDWCDTDPSRMTDRLVTHIRPGSVVVLHDGLCEALDARYLDREPMLTAVNMSLERLRGRFRFVTIPQLLRIGRPRRQNAYCKVDPDR